MESKDIEHYFTQAKRLPIAMSFAELSAILSSKGVTSPPNKSWWNLNNIILMSTLTLITTTLLVWLGTSYSNPTAQYQPKKLNYSTFNSVEENNQSSINRQLQNQQKYTSEISDKNTNTAQLGSNSVLDVNQTELLKKQAAVSVFSNENKTQNSTPIQQGPFLELQDNNDGTGFYDQVEQSDEFEDNSTVELVGTVEGESKIVTKKLDANELNLLLLQHKNGNIQVETWDQQKVEVTATFNVETKEAAETQKALNDFQVFLEKEGNTAKVSSNWDDINNCTCNSNSTSPKKGILKLLYFPSKNKVQTKDGEALKFEKFKIEYLVKVPDNFNVELSNKYGDIILTDNIGNAYLNLFQGNLMAKSLKNLELTSKYGNTNIGNVELAKVELFQAEAIFGNSKEMIMQAKYSNVKMGGSSKMDLYGFQTELESDGNIEVITGELKYGELKFISSNELELRLFQSKLMAQNIKNSTINSSYSEIEVGAIENLKFEKAFQSDIKLTNLGELTGELKYSELKIGNLKSSLDVVAFQGSIAVKIVDANFKALKIDTKYTDIDLKFDPDSKYDLDAQTTYSSFNGPSELVKSSNEGSSYGNQNHYAGTFNSASNKVASKVNLSSFQGSIKFE